MPDKPIEEWTLADVKQYCRAREECHDCKFLQVKLCGMSKSFPSHWNLQQKYSDEVIEFAKHIKSILPTGPKYEFWLTNDDALVVRGNSGEGSLVYLTIHQPNILKRVLVNPRHVSLDEILAEE